MPAKTRRGWIGLRYCAFIASVLLIALPYWPQWRSLQWLTLIILYAPPWWFLALFIPWLFSWRTLSVWQGVMLLPVIAAAIALFDIHLPAAEPSPDSDFITLSANLGNMTDADLLAKLLLQHHVDVALFQEAREQKLTAIVAAGWKTHCDAGLCIASRSDFTVERVLSRSIVAGFGNFAVFYRLNLPDQDVLLANVHLETPRPALESLLKFSPDNRAMQLRQQDRIMQATIISEWALNQHESFIIAGDFNMPVLSPIYQRYFSGLGNALSDKPQQAISYTKFTSWHGIRIDHQLYQGEMQPVSAKVFPLPGADHRPVLVSWRK